MFISALASWYRCIVHWIFLSTLYRLMPCDLKMYYIYKRLFTPYKNVALSLIQMWPRDPMEVSPTYVLSGRAPICFDPLLVLSLFSISSSLISGFVNLGYVYTTTYLQAFSELVFLIIILGIIIINCSVI